MDNQQEIFLKREMFECGSSHDLAWLAGLLDGEGSISVTLTPKPRALNVILLLSNSDSGILERTTKILDHFELHYHLQEHSHSTRSKVFYVHITGQASKLVLLLLVYEGLTRLRPQARLAIRFFRSRMERAQNQHNPPYLVSEIENALAIRDINKPSGNRKRSSEAIRAAFADIYQRADEDMVRSHGRP